MNPYTINPPESDVVFEKLCLALLKRHWVRPGLERFAKKGEEQFGVDIIDTRGEIPLYGAQCKLKEQGKALEPAEIRNEVEKAKGFPTPLDYYALLTTGKISGGAQLAIQAINQEHRTTGLFTVELFTWEKITDLIRQYPEIEREFFGGLRPEEVLSLNSKVDYLTDLAESVAETTSGTDIDSQIDEARSHITPGKAQIAVLLLNRLQKTKGDRLSPWHRFRILTNFGAASLILGRGIDAARYFFDAKQLRPEDELAIANEVLAHHLLSQELEAHEKATKAIEQFPNSSKLRALWIQSAGSGERYEELLEATPKHLRKDAEVASALSRRALADGSIDRAIAHAKDAVSDKPDWAQAHFLLGQTYFAQVALLKRSTTPLSAEDKQAGFESSLAAAERALSIAATDGDSHLKAQILALKSDIAILTGRKEDAANLARGSYGADPTDLAGLIAMAQTAFSAGNLDETIQILEDAYNKGQNLPPVKFMLGQSLLKRGSALDLRRAYDVFLPEELPAENRELIDPLVVGAAQALVSAKRFDEIDLLVQRPEIGSLPVLVATIRAFSALKQNRQDETTHFLDDAILSRRATDSPYATYFLATTTMDAGRLTDALPILQELFNAQVPNFDNGLLLTCAARLGRSDVILEACEVLHDRGIRTWDVVEFESQYLEQFDFSKGITRLQEFIAAHPSHKLAKLRLAIIGMRYGQNSLVEVSAEILPNPEDIPMSYAVSTILLLQVHEQAKLACEYAYRVLRAHYSELEAHKAYLASLIPSPPEEIPATMSVVEVGSAVQYREGTDGERSWFIIENTTEPSADFEELRADSDLARELLGKRVGDSFLLADSPLQDRIGTIVQVLSKYTRRFQVITEQMQIKFGAESVIHSIRIPTTKQLTADDLKPILNSVKAHSEAVSELRELYRSGPMTLHIYGDRLGHTAYEATLDLAIADGCFIRCAQADKAALGTAIAALGSKSSIVMDLTALATLYLLGITRQVLSTKAFRFLVSPATFACLQQLKFSSLLKNSESSRGLKRL